MAGERQQDDLEAYVNAPLLSRPPKLLEGQSAFISGATRFNGIGFSIAERFAVEGISRLVLAGTRKSNSIAPLVEARLRRYGVDVKTLVGDIASRESCREMMQSAYNFCDGNVDILVNNAGTNRRKQFMQVTEDDWEYGMIKAKGALFLTQAWFEPRNASKKLAGGRVIFIGSIIGEYGYNGNDVYAMSNSALIGLMGTEVRDLGPRGITLNIIDPGFIPDTEMTSQISEEDMNTIKSTAAINQLVRAQDIAAATLFFAGPDGERVTGTILRVDSGLQSSYTALKSLHREGMRFIPLPNARAVAPGLTQDEVTMIKAHRGET